MFGRDRSGTFECSATVVVSANRSLIATAGHCLRFGDLARKVTFVPAYGDGRAPFGRFPARFIGVTPQWFNWHDASYDTGVAVLRRNAAGQTVQGAVGARGIAWNQPRSQVFRAFGYPGTGAFDGERMFACTTQHRRADRVHRTAPRPMLIGCDMTRGSSGGGWVIGQHYVNSVVSHLHPREPVDHMYGPYFGSATGRLWRFAQDR